MWKIRQSNGRSHKGTTMERLYEEVTFELRPSEETEKHLEGTFQNHKEEVVPEV